jgi:predicted DNA-binding transcriptional regulator YafY
LRFWATDVHGPSRYILQLGDAAEVLEPKGLRTHLLALLKTMAGRYR